MSEELKSRERFEELRVQAEKIIGRPTALSPEDTSDLARLFHELHVYQTELEIQNSELERAQLELSDLSREYKDLYDFAPCGYVTLNSNRIIEQANLGAVTILGVPRTSLTKSGLSAYLKSDGDAAYQSALRSAGQTGERYSIELALDGPDQPSKWVRMEIQADRNESEEVKQWRIVLVDITNQKATEAALESSQQMSRAILDNIGVGVAVISPQMEILELNIKMREWFPGVDVGRKPICYQAFNDPPRDSICSYCPTCDTLRDGKVREGVTSTPQSDGVRHFRIVSSPIRDRMGEVVAAIEMVEDVTEAKRLKELEARAEKLELAGTIAGQVAHDFNNLLAPMVAYPELIKEILPENPEVFAMLDDMVGAAQKISDINQDLLAMGRRGHFKRSPVDLNAIVRGVVDGMKPLPESVTCEFDLCEEIMPVQGAGAQLHRLFLNLIHNAIDATQGPGRIAIKTENYYADDVTIAYGRVPKGEYVKVSISDDGCGIADDIVQRVFEPFFTTKATDRKRGSGLGLSVVDSVVKDHNGYLDLVSELGTGTTFYLYFPISRKNEGDFDSDEYRGGSESVLVVDDDDLQREVTSRMLESLGYAVSSASSGEEAVELLTELQRDLVILDMIMPGGIDGAETFQQILKVRPDQRAIIVSGFSETARVREAQALGAGEFVAKPITRPALAAAVRAELDRVIAAVSG